MKLVKRTFTFVLSFLLFCLLCFTIYGFKKGSCESAKMRMEMVDRLKKFTLIESFPFYLKKNKIIERKTQIIVLNSGVRYKFYTIPNPDYDGLPILSIYNNQKMEFLLGTTYNTNLKKIYNELEFECKTTGNYCLALGFQDGMEGCALGVFASLIKE